MSSEIELTGDKAVERFNSHYGHRQRALGFLGTAEGAAIAAQCVDRLAAFIERELAAPTIHIVKGEGLRLVLQRLPAEQIALAALDGVLNAIKDRDKKRRRRPPKHKSDAGLLTALAIGNALHLTCRAHDICRDPDLRRKVERSIAGGRRLAWGSVESEDEDGNATTEWRIQEVVKKGARDRRDRDGRIMWWADKAGVDRWNNPQIVRAGEWAAGCIRYSLSDVFVRGADGALLIYEHAVDDAAAIADHVLLHRPARFPSTCRPTAWTDWDVGGYGPDHAAGLARLLEEATGRACEPVPAPFVRDWHPDTKRDITAAMGNRSMRAHVDGVNALQAVPWRINDRVLELVKWRQGTYHDVVEDVPSARVRFEEDMTTATRLVGTDFYTPMNCDFRGRVNPMPDFNFGREDYVRACFLFAEGQPIGDGMYRLMAHAASVGDGCCLSSEGISKTSPTKRADWVWMTKDPGNEELELVLAIADRPKEMVELWSRADSPFMFLAACFELADAVREGAEFITHLPVSSDASCSGLQHMAAMTRSGRDGYLVNLLPGVTRQDCYQRVTDIVKELLRDDSFWTEQGITRSLTKKLVMTYPYAATMDTFWNHIEENFKPDKIERGHVVSFAKATWKAIGTLLDKPPKAMKRLQALASLSTKHGKPLQWVTPTGFPCAGRYYDVEATRVDLRLRGVGVQRKVAIGHKSTISKDDARRGASANFVQSMDAAHLILTTNAAVAEDIKSLAMVHDSFGCLAPQARRLNEIIRETFSKMYVENDVLAQIRASVAATIGAEDGLPPPFDYGNDLDLIAIRKSIYAFD